MEFFRRNGTGLALIMATLLGLFFFGVDRLFGAIVNFLLSLAG